MTKLDKPTRRKLEELLMLSVLFKTIHEEDSDVMNNNTVQRRRELVEAVENAVNALPVTDRELITDRYLSTESPYMKNYQVYEKWGIHAATYAEIRDRALSTLAASLHKYL